MGGTEDVRGRNGFLILICGVVLLSWIGGYFGKKELDRAKPQIPEAQNNKPVINADKLIREGGGGIGG